MPGVEKAELLPGQRVQPLPGKYGVEFLPGVPLVPLLCQREAQPVLTHVEDRVILAKESVTQDPNRAKAKR